MMFALRPVFLTTAAVLCWNLSGTYHPGISPAFGEASESGARIQVSGSVHDFGTIDARITKSVTHTFRFRNSGVQDLIVQRIETHCGCTSAIPSASCIAPGAEATLTAELLTRGRNGPQAIKVGIHTNDPTKPKTLFRMDGHILTPWILKPSVLDFGALVWGTTSAAEVVVGSQYFTEERVHRITRVGSTHSHVKGATAGAVVTATREEGAGFCEIYRPILVEVTAGEELGPQEARLQVLTNDPKSPTLELPVRWEVEGDLVIRPRKVFVSRTKGRLKKCRLQLLSRKGVPFEVLSVQMKHTQGARNVLKMTPEKNSTPTNKLYKAEVFDRVRNPRKITNHLGEVVFRTTHPEGEEISVPYTAIIRD